MSYSYSQKITTEESVNSWPEWATARHLLERLRPYFIYDVCRVTGDTWAKSWSISEKKGTLTLKCKELTAEGQKEARRIIDEIKASVGRFRIRCPIKFQTDALAPNLALFEMMG